MEYKDYVLVCCVADGYPNEVVVLKKQKPEWQNGLINLPGGKIEPGEWIAEAAARELKEETGLDVKDQVEPYGILYDELSRIYCCRAVVNRGQPLTGTDQEPAWWGNWIDLSGDPRLIPNLKVIIPLLVTCTMGWEIYDHQPSLHSDTHRFDISVRKLGDYGMMLS